MQLDLGLLVFVVVAFRALDPRGSFFLFQSCGVGLDFFEVVRGRGRRGIFSLDKYPSYRSKLSLTVLDYCLSNMGNVWAAIEINNRKLRDVNLLVGLCTGDMIDVSFSRFGSIWPWSTLSRS